MVLDDMNQMVMVLDSEMELLTHNLVSVVYKQVTQHHPDNRLLDMMVSLVYLDDRILQIRLLVYSELEKNMKYFRYFQNFINLLFELHGLSPPRGVCDPSY